MVILIYADELDPDESGRPQRKSWPPTDEEKNILESVRTRREALGLAEKQGAGESERKQPFVHNVATLQ